MIHLNTVHSLRLRYILGLSAIALLVTASFLTMQRIVSEQRNFSGVVNLAGHQAGLTNRISYFANIMATTHDESEFSTARSQIGRAIHKMTSSHHALRNGAPDLGIPLIKNENLLTIYDDPTVGLDLALTNFLEQATNAYNAQFEKYTINSASYIYITTYGPHVLDPLLDAAVDEYENIGKEAILKIERLEVAIWIAAIITLLVELFFIFIPMELHVRNALKSREKSITDLTKTRKRLIAAQQLALVGDWEYHFTTDRFNWSDQVSSIFGIKKGGIPFTRETVLNLIHPADRKTVLSAVKLSIDTGKASKLEYRIIRPDGGERLVVQYSTYKPGNEGIPDMIAGTIQDITEQKTLSSRLEKLSALVPGFLFQLERKSDGKTCVPYASEGIIHTHGVAPQEVSGSVSPMIDMVHENDKSMMLHSIEKSLRKLSTWRKRYRIHHPVKGLTWLEGHATPERLPNGTIVWYGYIWDITERKQTEDQVRKLALYDPLTGLANRRLLQDRLSHAINTSQRNNHFGAVLILDLDNFKTINDTKGHDIGDKLLQEVANRLKDNVRETDTVARLGGDEFVVVLELLGKKEDNALKMAMETMERIRTELSRSYYLMDGAHTHHGSASIGITLFKGKMLIASELMKRADVAMYEAKDLGKNRACLYSERRQEIIDKYNKIAGDLKYAIERDEFALYLQPQICRNGRLCGAETLLRWTPTSKTSISPGVFIPIAENTGYILPIGEWVLEEACRHLRHLEKYNLPDDFALAVNVSAKQINEGGFIRQVRDTVERHGVHCNRLKFELTESSLVQDLDRCKEILSELRDMGIATEVDDFGTGYSSLNSINKLPLDTLKIDGSLVQGIESESSARDIVRAIIAMANAMTMKVVAEGVETPSQSKFLIDSGCDMLQGFLYARPMPFEAFETYLLQHVSESCTAITEDFIDLSKMKASPLAANSELLQ